MTTKRETLLADLLLAIENADTDYDRRYGLVFKALAAAHALGYPAGFHWDDGLAPDLDGYRTVAYITLPTGQVSWHMPEYPELWDGHSTEEKYRRVHAYAQQVKEVIR